MSTLASLTQHVLTQPVCRSWDHPHPHRRGSERCRPSPKVTQLERGRLGTPPQDCGTPEPRLLPRNHTAPPRLPAGRTVEISPTAAPQPSGLSSSICTTRRLMKLPGSKPESTTESPGGFSAILRSGPNLSIWIFYSPALSQDILTCTGSHCTPSGEFSR